MECPDLIAIVGDEGNVHRALLLCAPSEPEFRLASPSKARPPLHFHDQFDAERRERAAKELLALGVVADGDADVVNDYGNS